MIEFKERERAIRSDPLAGKFSPTSLENFACPRAYYLSKCLRLEESIRPVTLHFGTCIHYAVGLFWTVRGMDESTAISTFGAGLEFDAMDKHDLDKLLSLRGFARAWSECETIPDAKRNQATGLDIVAKYCDRYKNDSSSYIPELIECPQWIEMPNNTMLGFIIDRLWRDEGCAMVDDTKTSSRSMTDWYFLDYEMSFQLTAYYYGVQQIVGDCDGVRIDGIKVPNTGKDDDFVRRSFPRTEIQVEEFLTTYVHKTNYIMDSLAAPESKRMGLFYQEPTRCAKYGRCKFMPICMHGLNHPVVKAEFKFNKEA